MFRSACFFLCLLLTTRSHSQQYYESYSPANGLVDARVTKMIQDGSGRLFFLTRDGFSIFDGQRIVNHTQFKEKQIGIINDAFQSADGTVVLATFNGNWLQCPRDRIISDSSFTRHQITEVSDIIPLSENGYLINSNYGLFIYRNGNIRELNAHLDPKSGRMKTIQRLAVSGKYMVFNYLQYKTNFVYLYNIDTERITDSLETRELTNIRSDNFGNVFVVTVGHISQLNKEDIQSGKIIPRQTRFEQLVTQPFNTENIFFDRQQNTWLIDSRNGCYRIIAATGETIRYSTAQGLLTGITSIFQDRENNFWFIAPGKGVQKLMQVNYESFALNDKILADRFYFCNTDYDSTLFLTSPTHAIVLKNNIAQYYSIVGQPRSEIVFYWQNNYWFFDGENRLINNKKMTVHIPPSFSGYSPKHQPSPNTAFDKEGNLLLAGTRIIVVKKDLRVSAVELPYFADNIVADENNVYYAFCRSNEIVSYTWKNNGLVKRSSFRSEKLEPRFAIQWNKDTFCIASRQFGIYLAKLDENSMTIIGHIDRKKGLSNDFAETLLKINEHQLAVGTASGLDIITMYNLDTLVENISSRVNHFEPVLQLARDDKGMIYSRTEDYRLFKYDPAKPAFSGYPPGAWFHEITVNNIVAGESEHRFSYQKNNFRFSVASPSFHDNRQINFQFLLTGDNNQWEQNSRKADFEINNLRPGSYTLTVTVKYPGRIYPDQKLVHEFTIRPPFWKTWWFYTLAIGGIIAIVLLLTRSYYKRRLQKRETELQKQQAVEKERTRIATDMHDDFGASLSRIKFLSEKMQVQQGGDHILKTDLEKISAYSDEMAEKMGEIVWALNQRYDSSGDLVSFCRSYASEFLEDKQITLHFLSGQVSDIRINGEIRRNVFLVMKESLNNIVKHAGATEITIEMNCDKVLSVVIKDNGRGFDPGSVRTFANGLENMKKRISEIGGQITIENNGGVCIRFSVDPGIHQNTYM